jgi:hypothetical protein
MIESLDSLIATAVVILGLSLIVQALQQIIKQTLDLKSTYMRAELLALFGNVKSGSRFWANVLPIKRLVTVADGLPKQIVDKLEENLRSFGFADLHLLEDVDAKRMKEIVLALPGLDKDPGIKAGVADALVQIDNWFDIAKKAFQEHYERRMRYWAFGLSAIVVVAMNANIFGIAKDFGTNRGMRDGVVAAAPRLVEIAEAQKPADGSKPLTDEQRRAVIGERVTEIQKLAAAGTFQILRWNTPSGDTLASFKDFSAAAGANWLGWLVMTLLVSLGAPFWYDILKTVMGMKERIKQAPTKEREPAIV